MALDPFGLIDTSQLSDAVWGGAGGVVKALTLKERLGPLMVSIIVGAITASKWGPVFDPVMDVVVQKTVGSLVRWLWADAATAPTVTPAHLGAFTVGVVALSLIAFIMTFTRTLMKSAGQTPNTTAGS